MSSDPKYVKFTFDWKIRWTDYDRIGKLGYQLPNLRQYFVPSFNNVSFQWFVTLKSTLNDASKIGFFIIYDDGPLDKISDVEYAISIVKSDRSLCTVRTDKVHEFPRQFPRRHYIGCGWSVFEDKDSTAVRSKYGLTDCDRLTYQVTIKIPAEAFAYRIPSPIPAPCSPWAIKLFDSISNAKGNLSYHPDVKVASRYGIVYNCHKGIVVAQSEALAIIFQRPPSQEGFGEAAPEVEQTAPNPKKRKGSAMDKDSMIGGVYKFPNLSAASLKAVLEYLYTGRVTTSTLTVTELIEMGDAGQQYGLKTLKEFCAAELWARVIEEEPTSAFEIVRFADLHDELIYLKDRAMDVIAEDYERLDVKQKLADRFGGTHGEELADELIQYMGRRLRPEIQP